MINAVEHLFVPIVCLIWINVYSNPLAICLTNFLKLGYISCTEGGDSSRQFQIGLDGTLVSHPHRLSTSAPSPPHLKQLQEGSFFCFV
jgi:hypothetical protein